MKKWITRNRAKGLINDAIHRMTPGKTTEKIWEAIDLLEDRIAELKRFLDKREAMKADR